MSRELRHEHKAHDSASRAIVSLVEMAQVAGCVRAAGLGELDEGIDFCVCAPLSFQCVWAESGPTADT